MNSKKDKELYILLHDIRSTHNVGSVFRTADAAGISKIFLTGYTPRPIDKYGRPVKELSKTALGGENSVEWEYYEDPLVLIENLKKESQTLQIIAVEQDEQAVDYKEVKIKAPTLFIFGNEVLGVSKELLEKADIIAEIPMRGKKESLNIGVSFGIALFRMLNL